MAELIDAEGRWRKSEPKGREAPQERRLSLPGGIPTHPCAQHLSKPLGQNRNNRCHATLATLIGPPG